jgi:hypothetical protein
MVDSVADGVWLRQTSGVGGDESRGVLTSGGVAAGSV